METNLKVAPEYAAFQAPIRTVPGSNHGSRKGFTTFISSPELMAEYRKQAMARFSTSSPNNYSQIIRPRTLYRMVNKARARFQDGIVIWPRSLRRVCGRSLAGFACSKPAGGMDSLLSIECCQVEVTDHSSRGVLPSVVCMNVIVKPR